MIKLAEITFPLAPDALAEMHEKALGRQLYKYERKRFRESAALCNNLYELVAATADGEAALDVMANIASVKADNDFMQALRVVTLTWLIVAAAKGIEAHETAAAEQKLGDALWM